MNFSFRILKIKYRQIGYVFAISRQKAPKCHIKFLRSEGIDGRPPILTPDELQIIEEEIKKQHQYSFYPSVNEITQSIIKNFKKFSSTDTVRHILRNKFKNTFKSITGVPLEDNRFNSKILEIENNINQLGRSINGLPIQFIFNIDEMGVSEFEYGRERTVIVPWDYQHSRAPYPISRSEKHATCLACINLCGLFCPPPYDVQRSTFDSDTYTYLDS